MASWQEPAKPFSKEHQLRRGKDPRKSRQVASKQRWLKIADAKQGPCRVCAAPPPCELHHIVSRAHGGADTESNLVPLCSYDHDKITNGRDPDRVRVLLASLTDAEYAYAIQHGGEGFFERAYGLEYQR